MKKLKVLLSLALATSALSACQKRDSSSSSLPQPGLKREWADHNLHGRMGGGTWVTQQTGFVRKQTPQGVDILEIMISSGDGGVCHQALRQPLDGTVSALRITVPSQDGVFSAPQLQVSMAELSADGVAALDVVSQGVVKIESVAPAKIKVAVELWKDANHHLQGVFEATDCDQVRTQIQIPAWSFFGHEWRSVGPVRSGPNSVRADSSIQVKSAPLKMVGDGQALNLDIMCAVTRPETRSFQMRTGFNSELTFVKQDGTIVLRCAEGDLAIGKLNKNQLDMDITSCEGVRTGRRNGHLNIQMLAEKKASVQASFSNPWERLECSGEIETDL